MIKAWAAVTDESSVIGHEFTLKTSGNYDVRVSLGAFWSNRSQKVDGDDVKWTSSNIDRGQGRSADFLLASCANETRFAVVEDIISHGRPIKTFLTI